MIMFWRWSHSFQQTAQTSAPMRCPISFGKGAYPSPSRFWPHRTHLTCSAIDSSPYRSSLREVFTREGRITRRSDEDELSEGSASARRGAALHSVLLCGADGGEHLIVLRAEE